MNCIQILTLIFYSQVHIKVFNMKKLSLLLLLCSLFFINCKNTSKEKEINIQNIEVNKSEIKLNGNEGNWYYNNKLFNGYMVTYADNGKLEQKVGFYNGKKQGIAKIWFPNGQLKVKSHYQQNKLIGSYKSWWPNGVLASEANYKNGKLQGVEKRWYASGQIAKQMTYTNGKEEGMQKAWLKNGKLYVNYEAKNGRIFGMKKANLCYQLEDEVVIEDERTISIFGEKKKNIPNIKTLQK